MKRIKTTTLVFTEDEQKALDHLKALAKRRRDLMNRLDQVRSDWEEAIVECVIETNLGTRVVAKFADCTPSQVSRLTSDKKAS
jgi:CHASE3 domain sensor protein